MSIPGEPALRGWRSFRWVGLLDAGRPALRPAAAISTRRPSGTRPSLEHAAGRGGWFLATGSSPACSRASSLLTALGSPAVFIPTDRAPAAAQTVALLVLAYAFASRVDVEIGAGSAVPTGLVFILMLFVLPVGQDPLWVAAGYLLGAAPRLPDRARAPRACLDPADRLLARDRADARSGVRRRGPAAARAVCRLYLSALLSAQLALDGASALFLRPAGPRRSGTASSSAT